MLLSGSAALAAPEWLGHLHAAGLELHGYADYRYGTRTQTDPLEDERSINEARLQLDTAWNHDLMTIQLKADLVADEVAEAPDDVDLETGHGFLDLRLANVLFSPSSWMDVRLGRQALTWGTGDLVFINDLFPKDWQSFFLGRDDEYLKAPSDAAFVSLFPEFASIDIAYTPRFDADRYVTGERLSYWNGRTISGQDAVLDADRPDEWFEDDEIAARVYRQAGAFEVAIYGYNGYWKSPAGTDPTSGQVIFPRLAVYGASLRGPMAGGICNLETGYYDSGDDRDGTDPFINNSETRVLAGYERELIRNMTIGIQYYLEHMLDYAEYREAQAAIGMPSDTSLEEYRHTLTLRITWLLLNQNLILSCFTRYSPSDEDVYVRPSAAYRISDRWKVAAGGNLFAAAERHTFLGQFEDNSNIHASLQYRF
jgi:hypothetical protein